MAVVLPNPASTLLDSRGLPWSLTALGPWPTPSPISIYLIGFISAAQAPLPSLLPSAPCWEGHMHRGHGDVSVRPHPCHFSLQTTPDLLATVTVSLIITMALAAHSSLGPHQPCLPFEDGLTPRSPGTSTWPLQVPTPPSAAKAAFFLP